MKNWGFRSQINNDIYFAQRYGINPKFHPFKISRLNVISLSFSSKSSRKLSCPKISLVFMKFRFFLNAYCYLTGGSSVLKFHFNIPCGIDHLSKDKSTRIFKFEVASLRDSSIHFAFNSNNRPSRAWALFESGHRGIIVLTFSFVSRRRGSTKQLCDEWEI